MKLFIYAINSRRYRFIYRLTFIVNKRAWRQLYALSTHGEIFSKSYQIKLKSDCINNFLIDFTPNGHPLGSKSIGKWEIQSDFSLILKDFSVCNEIRNPCVGSAYLADFSR